MERTKIEWCDSTWNPVTGCLHGCEYCYAREITKRFGDFETIDGTNIIAVEGSENGIVEVMEHAKTPYPEKFTPTLHRYLLDKYINRKGRNIFVCSMADLFGSWVPDSWIREVFKACDKAAQHNYLFLTKNPKRYGELIWKNILQSGRNCRNFWLGSTLTTPKDEYFVAYEYNTFWSIEPIMSPFDDCIWGMRRIRPTPDWIIIGAETGHRKNKVVPKREWIESILDQCRKAGVPVFMKSSLSDIWGRPLIQELPEELK